MAWLHVAGETLAPPGRQGFQFASAGRVGTPLVCALGPPPACPFCSHALPVRGATRSSPHSQARLSALTSLDPSPDVCRPNLWSSYVESKSRSPHPGSLPSSACPPLAALCPVRVLEPPFFAKPAVGVAEQLCPASMEHFRHGSDPQPSSQRASHITPLRGLVAAPPA